MKPTKPRIYLILGRPDGHCSVAEIEGDKVTSNMLDSAEDLLHTLTTGERPVIKNLYDLVAQAFGTTREDVKKRLMAAAYGMSSQEIARQSYVTDRDRRRIADGDRALALPDPQSDDEIRAQLEIIHDGMCALQSLDDLGEEGNRTAEKNLRELDRRYWVLRARLGHTARTDGLDVHALRSITPLGPMPDESIDDITEMPTKKETDR